MHRYEPPRLNCFVEIKNCKIYQSNHLKTCIAFPHNIELFQSHCSCLENQFHHTIMSHLTFTISLDFEIEKKKKKNWWFIPPFAHHIIKNINKAIMRWFCILFAMHTHHFITVVLVKMHFCNKNNIDKVEPLCAHTLC